MSIIHKHSWPSFMSITHVNIHEHHSCQHSWASLISTSMSITHVNQHKHSWASLMSISFKSFIYKSSSFKNFIYKSSSFESFIYRALASKLHLQSFTYKASVQGIQIPHPNSRHFGPYMDSIWSLQPIDSIDRRLGGLHYVPYIGPQLSLMKNTWGT